METTTITARKWTTGQDLGTVATFGSVRDAITALSVLANEYESSVVLTVWTWNGQVSLMEQDGKQSAAA